MTRATRDFRKNLERFAIHNEDAAIAVMRAADRIGDESLRQQLFNVIQRMHQDALDLRAMRDAV